MIDISKKFCVSAMRDDTADTETSEYDPEWRRFIQNPMKNIGQEQSLYDLN